MTSQYKTSSIFNPSSVLLTGATGYVGVFLLERLLQVTEADIFCLVRASSYTEGIEHIKKAFQLYRIPDQTFSTRIHVIVGDLAKPLLGLSPAQFSELAATVDAIYHCGALVNFTLPYSAMKGANVLGTQEIIRLACQVKPKAVHYISTIDTLLSTHVPRPYLEVDPPKQPNVSPDGYNLSKWVAENLCIAARERGVPVCIYRLPWVLGHTKTGVCPPSNNLLLLLLKGYLQFGFFPDSSHNLLVYDGISVDYAAQAIVHLSRQEESLGKIFHIWNLDWVSFNQIYSWIHAFGYQFDVVPDDIPIEEVKNLDPSHPWYPLIPILTEDGNELTEPDPRAQGIFDPRVECTNTIQGMKGSKIVCPPTDEKLTHLILSYLVDEKFLDPPLIPSVVGIV